MTRAQFLVYGNITNLHTDEIEEGTNELGILKTNYLHILKTIPVFFKDGRY